MPELRTEKPPARPLLIRAVASRLDHVVEGFRPIAEDLLAEASRIHVFGVDGDGSAVLALLGEHEEDALLLLARALAQRQWLATRLPDWLKLAPGLGVRPEAPVQAVVLCPRFGAEAVAAAGAVDRAPPHLVTWRFVRNGSDGDVLLDLVFPAAPGTVSGREGRAEPSPGPNGFRTGLSDADLGLSAEERAEFE